MIMEGSGSSSSIASRIYTQYGSDSPKHCNKMQWTASAIPTVPVVLAIVQIHACCKNLGFTNQFLSQCLLSKFSEHIVQLLNDLVKEQN